MKKTVILFSLFLFLFAGKNHLQAQTILSDTLFADTTLTASGNPYMVTTVLVIPDSVMLTVGQGVKIIFKPASFVRLEGSLRINGTATDSVYMVGENGALAGNTFNRIWEGIRFYGGELHANYLVGAHSWNFLTDFQSADIQVRNSSFLYNVGGVDIRNGAYFDSCHFAFGATGLRITSPTEVRNSLIEGLYTGVDGTYATVKNSVIRDNRIGMTSNGSRLENCIVRNNLRGVQLEYNGLVLLNKDTSYLFDNQIIDNQFGIWIRDIQYDKAVIANNVICNDSMNLSFGNVPLIDVRDNCWCSADRNEIVQKIEWLNTTAPFSPYIFEPFQQDCTPDDVWPGDANHDQVADMRDILAIGQFFGQTGPARPNASLSWQGQPAPDWGTAQPNGFDIKHVDCDGDSSIAWADTLAIRQNYGLSHRSRRPAASNHGVPLILQAPATMLHPGDTARMPIILGTIDTMAVNMYGIAFSIYYDSAQVLPTPGIRFLNSWLGTPGTDLITFYHVDTLDSRIDIALARNNQLARSGYGQIAELIVVIDDDIAKRQIPLALSMANPFAMDENGAEEPVKLIVGSVQVQTALQAEIASTFAIFPNPTNEFVTITAEQLQPYDIQLFDAQGRQIKAWEKLFGKNTLDVGALPEGFYLMRIRVDAGTFFEKVIIRR